MKFSLVCRVCGNSFSVSEPLWRCSCGSLLDIHGEGDFDFSGVGPWTKGLWRYADFLPIGLEKNRVFLGEGCTALVPTEIDGRLVWIKQEQCSPTGSFKDRGAAVLISAIKEMGISRIVEDSSGNAGCALAAYAAQAGIECRVYVPAYTSPGKLAQMRAYGAKVIPVSGTRQQTAEAAWEAAQGEYYAGHSWNPFFFQGVKTIAYELYEQMGFRAPQAIVLPVGSGTLLLGMAIGFRELLQAGLIEVLPRLFGTQAQNCRPLALGWEQKSWPIPDFEPQPTMAEGIAVSRPARGEQILEAVADSGGEIFSVTEQEILQSWRDMSAQGYFLEPTAAAAIAGCRRLLPRIPQKESVFTLISGHGLKAATAIDALLA